MARSPVRKSPSKKPPVTRGRGSGSAPTSKRRPGRKLLAVPVGGGPAEPALLSSNAFRTDSWVNASTGLGGFTTDRAAGSRYELDPIPTTRLVDALYTGDWLAARIIEKMPSIALVRGFTVEGASDPTEVLRAFEDLNTTERYPEGAFQRAMFDGRAYGAAGLFLGYELGDPLTPVDPETAGAIAFLDVFRQDELKVLTRVKDTKSADFGMPETYEVIGGSGGSGVLHPRRGQKFHASRLLRFTGKPLRTMQHELGTFPEIGVSVLAPVLKDISRYGMSWAAVSHLLQDASVGVMKLSGLVEGLASEDDGIILDRLKTLQATKGITRMMFLDADNGEDYGRVAVSFSDIPGVMAQIILSVSGAADMPAKILFGTSPMGLNANSAGEADLTQFYNSVDEYRRRVIGPKLEAVLRAITGNKAVRIVWPSLWEPTENEKAQTRLTNANATRAYWDMGAVQAKDIVKAAKEGVQPETIGTVSDEREPDPEGEGPGGGSPPTAPQGGPGARLAAALASEGRREDADEEEPDQTAEWEAEALAENERALAKAKVRFEKQLAKYEDRAAKYAGTVKAAEEAQTALEAAEAARNEAGNALEDIESEIEDTETRIADLADGSAEDLAIEEKQLAEHRAQLKAAKAKLKAAEKTERTAERARDKLDYKVENEAPNVQDVEEAAGEYHEAAQELGEEAAARVADEIDGHTSRIVARMAEDEYKARNEFDESIALQGNQARELRVMTGQEFPTDRENIGKFHKERAEHEAKMTEIGARGGRYYLSVTGRRVYLTDSADAVRSLAKNDPDRLAKILDEVS